ncbi:MAG: sulfatase-like hydrolase/transferase [Anaerolineae bacterium]
MKRPWVVHPFLVAAFPVLSLFWSNRTQVLPKSLPLPLLASVALAAVLFGALALILRHAAKAGLIVTLLLAAFFSYGHLQTALANGSAAAMWVAQPLVLLALLTLFWALAVVLIMRGRGEFINATKLANAASVCLVIIPLYNTALFAVRTASSAGSDATARAESQAAQATSPDTATYTQGTLPSIYYIILDGYARQDVLRDLYGYDNAPFLEALRQEGFFVADGARANYAQTTLSLSSALNLRYLDDVARDTGLDSEDRTPLQGMIASSEVSRYLQQQGYQYVTFSSGYVFTEIRTADVYASRKGSWGLDAFQQMLLSTTPVQVVLDALGVSSAELEGAALHRAEVLYTFDHLADVAALEQPVFVLAHIISPHPPFAFTADGQPIDREAKFSIQDGSHLIREGRLSREQYIEGYVEQLQFVNSRILQTVRAIKAESSTPPIIIIQADHGPGSHLDWDSAVKTDARERLSILSAYYAPEAVQADLYAGITPVNSFRLVFHHLFGLDLPLLEDRSYFSTWGRPYRFIDVTERIKAQSTTD